MLHDPFWAPEGLQNLPRKIGSENSTRAKIEEDSVEGPRGG